MKPASYPHLEYHIELFDVLSFQDKFDVPMPTEPSWPGQDVADFRFKFLDEELTEIKDAYARRDMKAFFDGCIDLNYVLMGTVLMFGCGNAWPEGWNEVQYKNMLKERVKSIAQSAASSGRASKYDVVKPAGWTPPDHTPWIGNGPWPEVQPIPEDL